jgi:hypothetical protein
MAKPNQTDSRRKRLIAATALAAILPWVWAVPFVPGWISVTALVVSLAVAAGVWKFAVTNAPAGEGGDVSPAALDAQNARRASRPIRKLLARWSSLTQTSSTELASTQDTLQGVIEEAESAVLNIGKSFRNITSRSSQQIEYAMGLLQTTAGAGEVGSGDSDEVEMSLPEYIRAYEVLLNLAVDRLGDLARDCLELVDGAGALRQPADSLGNERLRKLAEEARHDADQVKADAAHLSSGMELKNQQVTEVLKQINNAAVEIRKDVNQLVIAMQFQDITQQKLERVRGPLLGEIVKSLTSISDETRVLSRQLKAGAVPLPGSVGSQAGGSALPERRAEPAATPLADSQRQTQPKPATDRGDDSQVELF